MVTDYQSNGSAVQELQRENALLKRELAKARTKHILDRDAIGLLLAGGKPLSLEDVQERISAGGPYLEQLIEIEKEMKEEERVLIDTMANPVSFNVVIEDLERLLGEANAE